MIDEKKLLEKIDNNVPDLTSDQVYKIAEVIVKQPKLNEWIAVEERLPKEDERVLCLHSGRFIDCGVYIGETWCCDMDEYSIKKDDVIAWMPLPEPYMRKKVE